MSAGPKLQGLIQYHGLEEDAVAVCEHLDYEALEHNIPCSEENLTTAINYNPAGAVFILCMHLRIDWDALERKVSTWEPSHEEHKRESTAPR